MYFKCALCLQQRKIHYKMSEVLLFGNLAFICSLIKKNVRTREKFRWLRGLAALSEDPRIHEDADSCQELQLWKIWHHLLASKGHRKHMHSHINIHIKINKNISLRGFSYFETITEGKAHLFLCVLVGFFPNKFTEYLFIESNYMYFQ